MTRVSIVYLGRAAGMGEERRVATWRAVLGGAGFEVATVPLLAVAGRRVPAPRALLATATGAVVPETLAWSSARAIDAIAAQRPDVVVTITARAHDPAFATIAPVVLDYVDRLSVSYRDRAAIDGHRLRRVGFSALARTMARVERAPRGASALVAAGWADADVLGATWMPNIVEPMAPLDSAQVDHDLLFFGNLSYHPNVAAIEQLAALWPALLRVRPATTMLVAGAHPSPVTVNLVRALGWTLAEDFPSLPAVLSRARLAVAPLEHVAGIQNKVLEAAAAGLAQVVSPSALAGFGTALPAVVADSDDRFVEHVAALLNDDARRSDLGAAARAHVTEHYSAAAWAGPVEQLLASVRSTPRDD